MITVNDQKSNMSRQDDSVLRRGPSDGQSINSSTDPRSVPRNSEGLFSSENSPLMPHPQKQKLPTTGISSTRARAQSQNPKQQNKALPKLPGFKLQHKRDQPNKKKVLSKELAQVTEKDEYDYSPMKSNVTHDNLNFELAVKKHKQQVSRKGLQELDKELLDNQDKTGNVRFDDSQKQRHGSDYNLKKVNSIEDTDSHQFEDSLMEQSSPAADAKDLPYGNASGSYHAHQMTISSHDRKNMPASKKRIPRKQQKKSPPKPGQAKDGNYRNIKDYLMFIPNQPSVSQVAGKSRLYLAVTDPLARDQNTSISKSSARRLIQQSELKSVINPQREQTSLRNQVCISMASSHQASKKVSPTVAKTEKALGSKNVNNLHVNRSVIQPQKTEESLGSYQPNDANLSTERRKTRPKYHKMLTQKTNARRIVDTGHQAEAHLQLKKQKTQSVTTKERQASDPKQPARAAPDNPLNQIMFAQ